MDRNTVIGLLVIGALLVGYMFLTKPTPEQIEARQRMQDSIAQVKMKEDSLAKIQIAMQDSLEKAQEKEIIENHESLSQEERDSLNALKLEDKYGIFANAFDSNDDGFTIIENNKMIIKVSNLGGKIASVELKDYKTYYQDPLILYKNDSLSTFGLELFVAGKSIITNDMYFAPSTKEDTIKVVDKEEKLSMRLKAADDKYIEFLYTVYPDNYMLDFDINFVGLQNEINTLVNSYANMRWEVKVPRLERGIDWENNNTTIYLKIDKDIESLNAAKAKDEFKTSGSAHWIAYKQQFFSSVLIADEALSSPVVNAEKIDDPSGNYLKTFSSTFSIPLENAEKQKVGFRMYFGPNKFSKLKKYDIKLEKLVPLGWGIFGWVNKWIIIPIFNWLGGFINNYGLIIFLLTLIVKIGLAPLTYKSYLSSAKMRVLKPQVDALNEKYPKGKEMEKQQAVMALYKKAGVSPMGGCLPMLLQFPILIAMFRFFPASIELRQQSFLWANDLSSYDAIVEWSTHIPIISTFYGNHISLFTLLMAASMLVSTWITSRNQPQNNSMPGMKFIMYFMPVMMIIWFNKYSSGLSYYYFLANVLTILQTLIIQKFIINEEKLLAQMEANKKKPAKPKSKWQQRIEEAQRAQQQKLQQQRKK